MKSVLFFTAAILVAMTSSAAEQCAPKSSSLLFGRVGKLVFNAVKSAGAKAKCDGRICSFVITDFVSYDETDGCGGGTTGYGTSFTYADGKKFDESYCTGEGSQGKSGSSAGDALNEIFGELGLSKTAGWVSSIRISKVECVTNVTKASKEGAFANCHLTFSAE